MKTIIPNKLTINGRKFNLSKQGSKQEVENFKNELIIFNSNQKKTCGKDWQTIYKYRIKKYKNTFAIFTN